MPRVAAAARIRVRLRALRRRRVVGLHRAQHVRRDAAAAGRRSAPRASAPISRSSRPPRAGFAARWTAPRSWQRAIAGAARMDVRWNGCAAWLFSGFGWLSLGYSQHPGSPLAGYAPVGGVFAITLAVALVAAALALAIDAFARGGVAASRRVARGDRSRSASSGLVARPASHGRPRSARRSRCRSFRATCRRTSSSIPDFRPRTFDLYSGARGRRAAAASSCCPRARSPCSRARCPSRSCSTSCARSPPATATSWSASSRWSRRCREATSRATTTAS